MKWQDTSIHSIQCALARFPALSTLLWAPELPLPYTAPHREDMVKNIDINRYKDIMQLKFRILLQP